MERLSCRAALASAVWVGLAACSGAAPEAAAPAASPPRAAAAAQPVAPPTGSAPAAEGRSAAAAGPAPAAASLDATIALREQIERLVGSAACHDDSQCRALAMGSKPCGGPEEYIAWSTAVTDTRQLGDLAARYRDARKSRNQRLGLMSDCAVVPEPAVRCVAAAGSAPASGGRCLPVGSRGALSPMTR